MANLSVKLWKVLQQLKDDEFKKFKWFLKQEDASGGHSGISVAQLEKADRQDTVDLMEQKYGGTGAMKETMKVLEKINRNDIVESLQKSCPDPKDIGPLDFLQDHERQKAELMRVQQFAVDVTLDPDTENPKLTTSGDGKLPGDVRKKLLLNPERFYRCVCFGGQRIDQQDETNPNLK